MTIENVETEETQAAEETSPTLEEKVSVQLAAIQDKAVESDTLDESSESVADDDTDVEVDETEGEAAESENDSPILPAGHRRAALASGWTSEEVDYYLETKPDEATAKFGTIYDEWREENSQWSRRGRQLKEADETNTSGESDKPPTKLEKLDTQALIEEHGNEELINALTTPLNNVIDQVNTVLEKVSESQEFVQESTEETIAKIVDDFLTSKDMASFQDVYGKDAETLTDDQLKTRMTLFSEADDIIYGASAHGKKITVANALRRAHNNVSDKMKDTAIRADIRKSMKKRTKTLSGSRQKTASAESDTPLTREELIARTDARLQAVHSS